MNIPQDTLTIVGQPAGTHQLLKFRSGPVMVAVGTGLDASGYTLLADDSVASELYALLASKVSLI
jgi:hypothetical protein